MKTFRDMTAERLAEIVAGFSRLRVAVIGDYFLDKYLDVDPALAEKSLETGKVAHQVVGVRCSPGAAGTVVSNLSSLGCGTLYAIGFTGDDGQGYELRRGLQTLRCDIQHLLTDPQRMTPTYLKPRDINDPSLAGEHNRYDSKNRTPTPVAMQDRLIAALDTLLGSTSDPAEASLDAVIIADQVEEADCGVITGRVAEAIADRAKRLGCAADRWGAEQSGKPQAGSPNRSGIVFWADSRRRIRRFRHVIIKPNQFEAVGWENPPPDASVRIGELVKAVRHLREQTNAPVVVTRAAEGMLVSDPEMTLVPGVRVEGPIDPTGAGDSATAGTVLALAAGATLPEAALVGNLVASITVQQLATTGVARPEQLAPRLSMWLDQVLAD